MKTFMLREYDDNEDSLDSTDTLVDADELFIYLDVNVYQPLCNDEKPKKIVVYQVEIGEILVDWS